MPFKWSINYYFSATDITKFLVVSLVLLVIYMMGLCKIYKKAGKPAWGVFIPFYNFYLLFDILYKKGWKFLLLFVPFYNVYLLIKLPFRLAGMFGRGVLFGFGLLFLPFLFYPILGFGKFEYIYHTVPVDMMNSINSGDFNNNDINPNEKKDEYVNPMLDTLLKTSHTKEEISTVNSEITPVDDEKKESAIQTSFMTISGVDEEEDVPVKNTPQMVGGNPINSELSNAVNFVEFLPNSSDKENQFKTNDLLAVATNVPVMENVQPVGVSMPEVVPTVEATPQNFSTNVIQTPVSVENVQPVSVSTQEVVPTVEATPQNFSANVVQTPVSVENVQPVSVSTQEVVPTVEATPQNFSANVVQTPVSVENVQPVSVSTPEVVPTVEATPQNFSANVVQTPVSVENVQPVGVSTPEVGFNSASVPVQSINPVNIVGLEQTTSSFTGVNESSQQFDFAIPVLPPMVDTIPNSNTMNQEFPSSTENFVTDSSMQTGVSNLGTSTPIDIPSLNSMNSTPIDNVNNQ